MRFLFKSTIIFLIFVALELSANDNIAFTAKYADSEPCAITLELNNSATTPLSKVAISASIPQSLKLQIKNLLTPWHCKWEKDHTLSCHYPEIAAHTSLQLQFKIECQDGLDGMQSINFFLKAQGAKEQIEDVAMLSLSKMKSHTVGSSLGWHVQIGDDQIHKESNVTFSLQSDQARTLQIHCDEGLKLLENSSCRKKLGEGNFSCELDASSTMTLHARAMQYGFKICDFYDGNRTLSIPVDVQRSYIPYIGLDIHSKKSSIFEGENIVLNIDLNTSGLKEEVEDVSLLIKMHRAGDFLYEKIEGDDWECRQSPSNQKIVCKRGKILPHESVHLSVHLKAQHASEESDLSFSITPNSDKILPQRVAFSIVKPNFDKSHTAKLEPKYQIQSKGRMQIVGGTFYVYQEGNTDAKIVEKLPRAKLFLEPKASLVLPIDRNRSERFKLARLSWGGRIAIEDLNETSIQNLHKIHYKVEKEHTFHTCQSDTDAFFWKRDADMIYYQGSCNIEDDLNESYVGTIEIEIESDVLHADFGAIGSAQLLMITDLNTTTPPQTYTIFEGFEGVWKAPFRASHAYANQWQLNLKDFSSLYALSLGVMGADRGYGDRLLLSKGERKLFDKKDILVNSLSVDLDLDKDMNMTELPDKLSIESQGDRFFLFRVVATSSQTK